MKTVNLHTHFSLSEKYIGLVNHQVQLDFIPKENQKYSVGFHPWDIAIEPNEQMLAQVKNLAGLDQFFAIGECGIDRSIETEIELQKQIFLTQVEIAEELGKPIIIHAVRSYSDLLQLKKTKKDSVPWILHGYKGNPEMTEQLVKTGFFFSIGASILKDEEKQNQSLKIIPISHLFFETDESTINIESIYIFAASVLEISVTDLKKQIFKNFQDLFEQ